VCDKRDGQTKSRYTLPVFSGRVPGRRFTLRVNTARQHGP